MCIPVMATLKLMLKPTFFVVALPFVYLYRHSFSLGLPNCPDQMHIKI